MRPGVPDVHITDSQDAAMAEYRPLSGQAVLGLILGLLSPLALVDPLLWTIPAVATIVSWRALRRIKRSAPAISGQKLAILALALSLIFLAGAPTDFLYYRWLVRNEARQFGGLWFKYLGQDEPQKAYQLTLEPQAREPLDNQLWAVYRDQPRMRGNLEQYVRVPLVRTLLALGPKAQVRFYETLSQTSDGDNDRVNQVYAVSYEEENERKSFFVLVKLDRLKLPSGSGGWRVFDAEGGYRPQGW